MTNEGRTLLKWNWNSLGMVEHWWVNVLSCLKSQSQKRLHFPIVK
jgi:hypothetical protein